MNYVALNNIYELIKKMVDKHGIEDISPEKVYQGSFEKIPVWVYWDQGFENAPEIVQMCVNTIEHHLPYDKVQLIKLTKDNLYDYVKLPDYVIEKYDENHTYVSNIIRAALLYNYGGLWIDSTYLLMDDFDSSIFDLDFWAMQRCYYNAYEHKCLYDFTFNFCYSKPGQEVMKYMFQILCTYCKFNDRLACYFLKDGMIVYGYKHGKYPKEIVDNAEVCNRHMNDLFGSNINKYYSKIDLEKMMEDGTYIFKLTYKGTQPKEEIMGKQTFWGYLKEKYL